MDNRERIDDPEESLRMAIEGVQAKIWTALPGIVAAVNLGKQTVSVQPAIQGQTSAPDGSATNVNLPLLVDVPICWPRAGGFAVTFPVKVGDEVLVVFAARCIDSWWQSGGVGAQAEGRMHDLSDGFAILAPTSQPKVLSNVQTDGVEMRNEARDTYIKLTDGTIYIKGNIVHEGHTNQTGNVTQLGSLAVNGGTGVTMTGTITHTGGTISSNGKNIGSTHTHGGVQTGGGNTAGPN